MPKCAGCSGGGTTCNCSVIEGDGATVTGTGAALDPYIISAAGKQPYIVIGTSRSTPPDLLPIADYVADGTNDEVQFNAAITESLAISSASVDGVGPDILLLPGVYILENSVNPQGVAFKGATSGSVLTNANCYVGVTNTGWLGGAGGNRLFETAGPFAGSTLSFEGIQFYGFGAASIYSAGSDVISIRNCVFSTDDAGADPADIVIAQLFFLSDISYNSLGGCDVLPIYFATATTSPARFLVSNNISYAPMIKCENAGQQITISNNRIEGANCGITIPDYAVEIVNCDLVTISNNDFNNLPRGGILLTDSDRCHIVGNHISNYDFEALGIVDGIRLSGTSSDNNIQTNKISTAANGRHGVNVDNASCVNNMVTNNDLLNSGAGVSVNNAGTATITAAGNRL